MGKILFVLLMAFLATRVSSQAILEFPRQSVQPSPTAEANPGILSSEQSVKTDNSQLYGESKLKADSLNPAKTPPKDSLQVIRHLHNHRQQVIAGGVMMSGIILILVFFNNYNPK